MSSDILVRAVLSGEAVYKTASLGLNNLMFLEFDKNKYYLITKIVVQPFANLIDDNDTDPFTNYSDNFSLFSNSTNNALDGVCGRSIFQLVYYSQDYQHKWTGRASVQMTSDLIGSNAHIHPSLIFESMELDVLIGTSSSPYFYFVFPNFWEASAVTNLSADVLSNFFNERNFVPPPQGGIERSFNSLLQYQTNLSGAYNYAPVGLPNLLPGATNPTQTGTINFGVDNVNSFGYSTMIVLPVPPGSASGFGAKYVPSLPTIQVHYYEFNRKPTFQGISGQNQLFSQG